MIAFLLATPELGVESLALTARFLGWEFAILRLVAAMLIAICAAWLAAKVSRVADEAPPAEPEAVELDGGGARLRRAASQLDELFLHILPFTVLGLIAAAYVEAFVEPASVQALRASSLDILVVSAVAIPVYVCATSATPLAAVLIAKGLSPGAALVGLLLGPATNVATLGYLRATFGARVMLAVAGGAVVVAWGHRLRRQCQRLHRPTPR